MNEFVPIKENFDWSGSAVITLLESVGYTVLRIYDGTETGTPFIILKPPAGVGVGPVNDKLTNGSLFLNLYDHTLYEDGKAVKLTVTELKIVELFMKNPGHVFSSEEIYKRVWKATAFSAESIISVHINHIRKKIERVPTSPKYIKTVWGAGYVMEKIEKE